MACLGVEPGAAGWKAQTNILFNKLQLSTLGTAVAAL